MEALRNSEQKKAVDENPRLISYLKSD